MRPHHLLFGVVAITPQATIAFSTARPSSRCTSVSNNECNHPMRNDPLVVMAVASPLFGMPDSYAARLPQSYEAQQRSSETRLQYRNTAHDDDVEFLTTIPTISTQENNAAVSPLDLPRHTDATKIKETRIMMDMEMMLGRIAMIAALVLFGTELATGQSFAQQFAHMFMS